MTTENKTPEDTQKHVDKLREWINQQPHLPKDLEDKFLLRFLHSCYYDVEKTINTVQLFFSIRSSVPELMSNRDPLSTHVQNTLKIVNSALLKIPGNKNLWIFQLNDPGLSRYNLIEDMRLFLMTIDTWLLDDDELEEADIILLDVKDITLKIITKFNFSLQKKMSKYQQEAIPIRLKEVHIVNAPPVIHKIFGFVRPFLNQDIQEMMHFHTPKSETLYKYINKDELPEDFGGTLGKMEDHMKKFVHLLISKREYFLKDDLWTNVNQKTKKTDVSSTQDEPFRSLTID